MNSLSKFKFSPDEHLLLQITFFAFGVSSYSGWNALLMGMGFFQQQFLDHNVAFLFPVPSFVSLFLVSLILTKQTQFFSLDLRIIGSLLIVSIILILLPLIAMMYTKNDGVIVSLILIFILSGFNGVQLNSSLAIASTLGSQYINMFLIGNGFSGVIIGSFRIVCQLLIKEHIQLSIILMVYLGAFVYFCIAALWNLISIFLFILFAQTSQYEELTQNCELTSSFNRSPKRLQNMYDIKNSAYSSPEIRLGDIEMKHLIYLPLMNAHSKEYHSQDDSQLDHAIEKDQYEIIYNEKEQVKKKTQLLLSKMNIIKIVAYINRITYPIPIFITLVYIQTFMMFPGLALHVELTDQYQKWGYTLMIFVFNVFDTIGKYFAGFRAHYSEKTLVKILLLRLGNIIVFILITIGFIQSQWLIWINLIVFSFTNGLTTSGFMQLGPEKVDTYLKEKVGFVQGFHLSLGMMLGTILALPLQTLQN